MSVSVTGLQLAVSELQRQVARLQTIVDVLESRLTHVHELLICMGFPEGIVSLMQTIEDILGHSEPEGSDVEEEDPGLEGTGP